MLVGAMRSVLVASFVAVASAYRSWNGIDTKWATHPDRTAQWYEEHAQSLPGFAKSVTTVVASKSSIVKLDCVGCPFRVRKLHQESEEWQEPPQDNSLVRQLRRAAMSKRIAKTDKPTASQLHHRCFRPRASPQWPARR
jgi:hypothetical protein